MIRSAAIVSALRSQAAALRVQADTLDATAAALDAPTEPSGAELVTRRTWAGPCSWRVISDAAKRGELPMMHAGRTPAVRRADVERWIASRTVAPRTTDLHPDDELDDYQRAVRAAGGAPQCGSTR